MSARTRPRPAPPSGTHARPPWGGGVSTTGRPLVATRVGREGRGTPRWRAPGRSRTVSVGPTSTRSSRRGVSGRGGCTGAASRCAATGSSSTPSATGDPGRSPTPRRAGRCLCVLNSPTGPDRPTGGSADSVSRFVTPGQKVRSPCCVGGGRVSWTGLPPECSRRHLCFLPPSLCGPCSSTSRLWSVFGSPESPVSDQQKIEKEKEEKGVKEEERGGKGRRKEGRKGEGKEGKE